MHVYKKKFDEQKEKDEWNKCTIIDTGMGGHGVFSPNNPIVGESGKHYCSAGPAT